MADGFRFSSLPVSIVSS